MLLLKGKMMNLDIKLDMMSKLMMNMMVKLMNLDIKLDIVSK